VIPRCSPDIVSISKGDRRAPSKEREKLPTRIDRSIEREGAELEGKERPLRLGGYQRKEPDAHLRRSWRLTRSNKEVLRTHCRATPSSW